MASDGMFSISVASVVEDVLQQHGTRLSDNDLASRKAEEAGLMILNWRFPRFEFEFCVLLETEQVIFKVFFYLFDVFRWMVIVEILFLLKSIDKRS